MAGAEGVAGIEELDKPGIKSEQDQKLGRHSGPHSLGWARARGAKRAIYSNSLIIVMSLIFLGSWFAHSVTAWTEFNSEQRTHDEAAVSWWSYVGSSDFWESTFQNWQSEFQAVGSFAVLTIYLRQRGSPEWKPVGSPHDSTGIEG